VFEARCVCKRERGEGEEGEKKGKGRSSFFTLPQRAKNGSHADKIKKSLLTSERKGGNRKPIILTPYSVHEVIPQHGERRRKKGKENQH